MPNSLKLNCPSTPCKAWPSEIVSGHRPAPFRASRQQCKPTHTQPEGPGTFEMHLSAANTVDGPYVTRRAALTGALWAAALFTARNASSAILQFPVSDLKNQYYLVRAGEAESEFEGYVLTNPVSKTSMSSGLSKIGKRQVLRETLPALQAMGACEEGCWIWPSITQRSYQTAEILASQLQQPYSRINPEYSFLDPRGLGGLERSLWADVAPIVEAGDRLDSEWRPPRGTDGTPPETVMDVFVRVRQLLSICETQYRGEDILIISPDSYNLSVMQAAVLGLDLRRHSDFAFRPGEARRMVFRDDLPPPEPTAAARIRKAQQQAGQAI